MFFFIINITSKYFICSTDESSEAGEEILGTTSPQADDDGTESVVEVPDDADETEIVIESAEPAAAESVPDLAEEHEDFDEQSNITETESKSAANENLDLDSMEAHTLDEATTSEQNENSVQNDSNDDDSEMVEAVKDTTITNAIVGGQPTEKYDDEKHDDNAQDGQEYGEKMEAAESKVDPGEDDEVTIDKVETDTEKNEDRDSKTEISEKEDHKSGDRRRSSTSTSERRAKKRSRSRSRSKRSTERRRTPPRNQPAQNTDDFTNEEDEPVIDEKKVALSWFDSDLHLEIEPEFESAKPVSDAVLSLVWAGARATHGVKSGRVLYEVQVTGHNHFYNNFPEEKDLYELRCGWSVQSAALQLGESPLSFGFGSVGKKATNSEFTEYGIKYGKDDIIGCYLDLESSPCTIEYTVNGKSQGVAFEFEKSELGEQALYPHVLSKNSVFRVNFGQVDGGLLQYFRPRKDRSRRSDRRRSDRESRSRDRSHEKKTKPTEKVDVAEKVVTKKNDDEENWDEEEKKMDVDEKTEKKDSVDEKTAEEMAVDEEESEKLKKETTTETEIITEADAKTEEVVVANKIDEDEPKAEEAEVKTSEEVETAVNNEENSIDDKKVEEKEENKEDEIAEDKSDKSEKKEETDDKIKEPAVPLVILEGYTYVCKVAEEELIAGAQRPTARSECEVIMMVGLPGAGKTHWVINHLKENAEKRYTVISNPALIERMNVS